MVVCLKEKNIYIYTHIKLLNKYTYILKFIFIQFQFLFEINIFN